MRADQKAEGGGQKAASGSVIRVRVGKGAVGAVAVGGRRGFRLREEGSGVSRVSSRQKQAAAVASQSRGVGRRREGSE